MAFWGKTFVFNDFPCEEFGLMLYDIGNETQGEGTFASTVSIIEEVVGNRWKPWFYGVKYEKKLQMDIIFGVDHRRLDQDKYLDRYEIDEIASWLTGHDKYLWLEIEQEDMEYVRYHCMITELSIVSYGNIPWAMKASIICDSPYAYLYHASGELCEYYSAEDMTLIVSQATQFKTYHTSYFNSLKNWVESMGSIAEVGEVSYGDPVPAEFCSVVLMQLLQAQEAS